MDIQQYKQLVENGYRMFRAGDIDGLLQLFSDDIEWIGSEVEYTPFSAEYHGRQEVGRFFSELSGAQEVEMFEPHDMIAEGDKVAVTGEASWRVRSTGKHYSYPWMHLFTVKGGKIVRFQQYFDTAATRAAFMPTGMGAGADAGIPAPTMH